MSHSAFDLSRRNTFSWSKTLPWIVFLTGVLYYCFAYLLRVYPSVMEYHLLSRLHVSVKDFGLITGFYYVAYAPMQLPVGVTVDRIGARLSLLLGCLIACLGVLLFANTQSFDIALAARFMIGIGAAFGYVTALKIATLWLPRQYFATATGFVTGAGMIAAIFTDNYLTHLINTSTFQSALYFPWIIGVILFILIFLFVRHKKETRSRDDQPETQANSYRQLFRQLIGITKKPQMWLIGAVGALLYLPSSVFIDAWAIPFLKTARHFTAEQAAFGASMTLAGWIISSFVVGYLSDRFHTRKIPLVIASSGATILFVCILFMPINNVLFIDALLFLLGVFCGPHPLCFSLGKENCVHRISGTAVAFTNFIIMIGGMILQPAIGGFLVLIKNSTETHVTHYSGWDFSVALSIIPVGLVLAFLGTLLIKETYGKDGHI